MFADIAHGHTDAADVLYLIAAVLFVVAALGVQSTQPVFRFCGYIGAAFVAVGLLVL